MAEDKWLCLVVLCFTVGASMRGADRDAGLVQEQGTPAKAAPAGQDPVVPDDRILQTRRDEVKVATDRILQTIREDRDPNQRDVRLMNAFRTASAALAICIVVQSPHFTYGKRFRRDRLEEGIGACKRVIRTFNADGAEAYFSPSDLEFLQALQRALGAAEALQRGNSPAVQAKLKKEQRQRVLAASQRIVDEFNTNGGNAHFAPDDMENLKVIAQVLAKLSPAAKTPPPKK